MENEQPTIKQNDDAKRVQKAISRELALLAAEGVEPQELVSGACAAVAEVIAAVWGAQHVATVFAQSARLASGDWAKG